MASNQSIQDLVSDTAALLGLPGISASKKRAAWQLDFDATTTFDIEHDAVEDRIVIIGGVGPVGSDGRQRARDPRLVYNYRWAESGGVRMALDGDPGSAVTMVDIPATGVGPAQLCTALCSLANVGREWRQILKIDDKPAANITSQRRRHPCR